MVSKKVLLTCSGLVVLAVILVLVLLLAEDAISEQEEVLVNTTLGGIKGAVFVTRLHKKFMAFRGIRFAEPPVNDLRFSPPVPVKSWHDVFDATEEGPACLQDTNDFKTSEDCLRLNVYTNELPSNENSTLKPVIAFIHGGGLSSGNSLSSAAGGEYLLDRDVVLVTFNYRLSSLGFISTGTVEAPGNNGFKDQVIALRWIRDHISIFGGDPKSVTLMGQGAGGRSVMLHLASPMSQGLFHKAIIMSGSVTGQWDIPVHQAGLAQKQATMLGCQNSDISAMMECMRKIKEDDIDDFLDEFNEFEDNPTMVWYPVIEPDFGQERFLIEDPSTTFASGKFAIVPIIIGITKDEFAAKVPEITDDSDNLKQINDDFDKIGPICFMYERDTAKSRKISRFLWSSYIVAPEITKTSSFTELKNLFSDGVTGFAVNRFVKLANMHTSVYYYMNSFVGQQGNFYYPENSRRPNGTVHADDLIYLFKQHDFPLISQSHQDADHLEQILDLWTSFASSGNPNNASSNDTTVAWAPFEKTQENYLEISTTFETKSKLFDERYRIWESLFPMVYP